MVSRRPSAVNRMWPTGVQARCRSEKLVGARRGRKKVTALTRSAVNKDHLAGRTGPDGNQAEGQSTSAGDGARG